MHKRKMILIVDDDDDYRELLSRTMEKLGFDTLLARDGVDALNIVRMNDEDMFSLVWADLNMPRLDGFQLACALRGLRYRFPIVITSGHFEGSGYSDHDLAKVANEFIEKEMHMEKVRVLIRKLLPQT